MKLYTQLNRTKIKQLASNDRSLRLVLDVPLEYTQNDSIDQNQLSEWVDGRILEVDIKEADLQQGTGY